MKHFRGFSLLETLVVLTLVAVLLGLAVPALATLALDSRRRADLNAFVGAVELARSEAAKRAAPVRLCPGAQSVACDTGAGDFNDGWVVLVSEGPEHTGGSRVLLAHTPHMDGTIRSNRASFTFRPYYRRGTNGTVTFCDRRGAASARAVIVSYTGRPRVSAAGASGRALECGR